MMLPLENLELLAGLIKERNALEERITAITHRPAEIGHIGEYIASQVFHISLYESAAHKGSDGCFNDGVLKGKLVNIKWYGRREGVLDITPDSLPDYYLVMIGPKTSAISSRGLTRPWVIANMYLFNAHVLVAELEHNHVKIGVASSVRQNLWEQAEIYPINRNDAFRLLEEQKRALALFGSNVCG